MQSKGTDKFTLCSAEFNSADPDIFDPSTLYFASTSSKVYHNA
jgi:hypothetical protein